MEQMITRRDSARRALLSAAAIGALMLGGCAAHNPRVWSGPEIVRPSKVQQTLATLPPPRQRVAVAVYGFTDQTGQFKQSDTTQSLSRAVTQGATSILIKALQDSGQRQWFQVIERERLDNVLRERAVIREMRANYLGEKTVNPQALPPLLFAGILLEGGIIGYDSNTKSGGVGARFLGIGGHAQYREDTITLFLRAVSVKSGEVLTSVSVRKTIASVATGADSFRYVAFKDLLEVEAGVAYNEPDELALQQAIEKAVHSLIMEGTLQNLWCFSTDSTTAETMLRSYVAERDHVKPDAVRLPASPWSAACPVNAARIDGTAAVQSISAALQPRLPVPTAPTKPLATLPPAAQNISPPAAQSAPNAAQQPSTVTATPTPAPIAQQVTAGASPIVDGGVTTPIAEAPAPNPASMAAPEANTPTPLTTTMMATVAPQSMPGLISNSNVPANQPSGWQVGATVSEGGTTMPVNVTDVMTSGGDL